MTNLKKFNNMPKINSHPSFARDYTIGQNIRQAREARGITQLALAHLIGWQGEDAGAHISRYESGQKEPRISTLEKIARSLAVTLESLLAKPAKK